MLILSELIALFLPVLALAGSAVLSTEHAKLRLLVIGQVSALAASVVGLAVLIVGHPFEGTGFTLIPNFLEFRVDFLEAVMALIITFISSVVVRFSEQNLVGDKTRWRFVQGLVVLAAVAKFLVASDNLILCLVCWHAISLMLWRLVGLRESAKSSARMVLRYHLASDLLFLCAVVAIAHLCGTTRLTTLGAHIAALHQSAEIFGLSLSVSAGVVISVLLVLAMAIKTALFPFHRWLLATLEAPTSLSGLLHAGIVNVAAILAWRLFPVLAETPYVLLFWGILAAISSVVGTMISSAQSDVKRKLVYSTVGQMGFMSLQCAVGLAPAAVFHLIAHGLFKCHLFLRSGSTVADGLLKRRWNHAGTQVVVRSQRSTYLAWCCVAVIALPVCYWLIGDASAGSKTSLSVLIMTGAIATTLPALQRIGTGVFITAGFIFTGAVIMARFLSERFDTYSAPPMIHDQYLLTCCVVFFGVVSLVLHFAQGTARGNALYVHALNGFYLDEVVASLRGKFAVHRAAARIFINRIFGKGEK